MKSHSIQEFEDLSFADSRRDERERSKRRRDRKDWKHGRREDRFQTSEEFEL